MARFELKDSKSSKFWEIAQVGKKYITTYGQIGKKGRSSTKSLASSALAKKKCEQLMASKLSKGYKKVITVAPKQKESKLVRRRTSDDKKSKRSKAGAKKSRRTPIEREFFEVVDDARKTVRADAVPEYNLQSNEAVWHLEESSRQGQNVCLIEILGKKLRVTLGPKGEPGQVYEETLETAARAEYAGVQLAGGLLGGKYRRVKEDKSPKKSKAERICQNLISEIGKRKLEHIGQLAQQVSDGDTERSATELLKIQATMGSPIKSFLELIAVASGAEIAAMGERGDFLLNVVTSECPDEDDIDVLVEAADAYVDTDSFWGWIISAVSKLLFVEKRIRKPFKDFAEKDKLHYYEVMEASFDNFVRPRLVNAVKRYR